MIIKVPVLVLSTQKHQYFIPRERVAGCACSTSRELVYTSKIINTTIFLSQYSYIEGHSYDSVDLYIYILNMMSPGAALF